MVILARCHNSKYWHCNSRPALENGNILRDNLMWFSIWGNKVHICLSCPVCVGGVDKSVGRDQLQFVWPVLCVSVWASLVSGGSKICCIQLYSGLSSPNLVSSVPSPRSPDSHPRLCLCLPALAATTQTSNGRLKNRNRILRCLCLSLSSCCPGCPAAPLLSTATARLINTQNISTHFCRLYVSPTDFSYKTCKSDCWCWIVMSRCCL